MVGRAAIRTPVRKRMAINLPYPIALPVHQFIRAILFRHRAAICRKRLGLILTGFPTRQAQHGQQCHPKKNRDAEVLGQR